MSRSAKTALVEDLRGRFDRAPAIYLTDFTGLDVKEMTKLRRELKAVGAECLVIKNRLAKLSLARTDLPDVSESLVGPTGVVLGYDDAVAAAKALNDFQGQHDSRPVLKVGVLEDRLVDADEVQAIANLPPRETLYAQLAGALEAPLAGLAATLAAKLQEMVGLIEALQSERGDSD